MTDPTTSPTHFDPATIRALWAVAVAIITLVSTAIGGLTVALVKLRAWSLRSERAAKTDDHVHGVGRTVDAEPGSHGLVHDVTQLKDAVSTLVTRVRNGEIEHGLPDMSDPEALARFALARCDTGQHQRVILEETGSLPPPRPRPDGRWRGGGGPAE